MSHHCHAAGCVQTCPPKMFMCRKHWFSLPAHMKSDIWKTYRPGQEDDKSITKAYSKAAQKAIRFLADKENRTEKEVREACLVYKLCEED